MINIRPFTQVLLTSLLALAICLPSLASAKSLKRKNDRELVEILRNDSDHRQREEAAKLLGDRESAAAITYLSEAIFQDPDEGVRIRALGALEQIRTTEALDEVQAAFEHEELADKVQIKALKILRKHDAPRCDHGTPHHLSRYRNQEQAFVIELLKTMVIRDRTDARDIPLVIAMDRTAKRKIRVQALQTAEKLRHPNMHDAYLTMLDDPDKKVRIRSIEGLSRSGLPGSKVGPALTTVVRTDSDGNVRAKALKALKFYAHPNLLPMIHDEVLNEKNPVAWGHAMDLLESLADKSSLTTITILLGRDEYILEETVVKLILTTVRIGDPSVVPHLESLQARSQSLAVAEECKRAIKVLRGDQAERERVVSAWTAPADVIYYRVDVEPQSPGLSVHIDDSGMIVNVDGGGSSWTMESTDTSVSYREESSGSWGTSVSTSEGYGTTEGYSDPASPTAPPLPPAPCDAAEIRVNQVDGVWYDLFVNGDKKIEARVGDDSKRIGGLEPGTYHIRVTHFMGDVWSEGRLEVACGDTIAAEIAEDKGFKVLNHPEWYRAD